MDDAIGRHLDAAVRAFRTAAGAWLVVVTGLSYASVDRPVAAALGVAAAVAVTAAWWHPSSSVPTVRARLIMIELAVGALLLAGDGWVYDEGRAQSLGGIWPVAGVLAVALDPGIRAAMVAGAGLGVARAVGEVAVVGGSWSATRALGVASTGVVFALAGWAAGWAAARIQRAEHLAARAEARAEVAAELHDGVLQTLAVVQRRSDDGALIRLARTQEAELRRYLVGADLDDAPEGAEAAIRAATADATTRFGLRIEVAIAPPLPDLGPDAAEVLRRALGECLANVAKHAGVDRAVLFAEVVDGHLVTTVRDDGVGFDPPSVPRRGLATSVEDRIRRVDGRVEVESEPGRGATVCLTIPLEAP